jgi:hypothetical protein
MGTSGVGNERRSKPLEVDSEALGLVLGVWMLRLTPERRAGAAVALVAAGLGLLGTEAFLAWRTLSAPPPHGPGFDSRSVLEVVRDLRAQGTPAVPALLSSYARASGSELVPLGGLADADTVFCNESGAYVVYRSDSDGFNNPPDAAGDVDFVVLGDSFAHGQCVPQGMDVAGRIGGGVELIHFGRGLRATGVVACCCPAGSGAAV